ncbi:hypothetical protein D3C87_1705880 [compost metagenome]
MRFDLDDQRLEIEGLGIACILEDERLGAIADQNECLVGNDRPGHRHAFRVEQGDPTPPPRAAIGPGSNLQREFDLAIDLGQDPCRPIAQYLRTSIQGGLP